MQLIECDMRPAVVNEAIGIVSAQADCTRDEALALLRQRALTFGQGLEDLAVSVANGSIRFGPFLPPARPEAAADIAEIWLSLLEEAAGLDGLAATR